MGRRGPPPEPTALKLLKGNPGKRAVNRDEPKPAKAKKGERRCPASMPPAAKRAWRLLVPELERLNLLTRVDDLTLEGACKHYAKALQADAILKKQGLVIVTDKGFVLQHPAAAISRNEWAAWLKFAVQFGLTPSARSNLHIAPASPRSDPDEEFLFKRKSGNAG